MHPETARSGRLLYVALGFLGLDLPPAAQEARGELGLVGEPDRAPELGHDDLRGLLGCWRRATGGRLREGKCRLAFVRAGLKAGSGHGASMAQVTGQRGPTAAP
jgi:hypothetical protein